MNSFTVQRQHKWDTLRQKVKRALPASTIPEHQVSGLSSGEGIIHAVRDPRYEIKQRDGVNEEQLVDAGVDDKRLLIVEGEFANVLTNFSRKDNKLSAVLRDAWDNKDLRTLTKNSPDTATAPHIGFCAHITQTELKNMLLKVQVSNGFCNRILWVHADRSKLLAQATHKIDLIKFTEDLQESIDLAKGFSGCLEFTENAQSFWNETYPILETDRPNEYINSLTSRAAPIILRMAGILALLTKERIIHREHLQQALSLWKYAEESIEYIFGDSTGNTDADKLLRALQDAGSEGLTRTEITRDVFQGHKTRDEINITLENIEKTVSIKMKKNGNKETWFPVAPK